MKALLAAALLLPAAFARAQTPPAAKDPRIEAEIVLKRFDVLLRAVNAENRRVQALWEKSGYAKELGPARGEIAQEYGSIESALLIAALTKDPERKLQLARADERKARGRYETYLALISRSFWDPAVAQRGVEQMSAAQDQAEEFLARLNSLYKGQEIIAVALEPVDGKDAGLRVYAPADLDPSKLETAAIAARVSVPYETVPANYAGG